jgi:hypothetical protein
LDSLSQRDFFNEMKWRICSWPIFNCFHIQCKTCMYDLIYSLLKKSGMKKFIFHEYGTIFVSDTR